MPKKGKIMFVSLNRVVALWSTFLVVASLIGAGLPAASRAHEKTVIAIYNDTFCENKGVWRDGIIAIKAMLNKYGYSHQDITPDEINSANTLHKRFKIILFPGGWAGAYNAHIKTAGFRNLRTFVSYGGGFFGICAGAYFACDVITWKPDANAPEERYDYPLNLFEGTGKGVLPGVKDWTAATGCASITRGASMVRVKIDNHILPIEDPCLKMLYYGGPSFKPFPKGGQTKTLQVAATYMVPGTPADGMPAMIFFPYGKGKVFLSGIHPEISLDDCTLHYDEKTWKLMNAIISLLLGKE
ncbi:MAG: hypothetical protein JRI80_03535 [Deltaproteobacteria bacterium]|nr:hypothetical protein [Deltaproteobacteria bacterium]